MKPIEKWKLVLLSTAAIVSVTIAACSSDQPQTESSALDSSIAPSVSSVSESEPEMEGAFEEETIDESDAGDEAEIGENEEISRADSPNPPPGPPSGEDPAEPPSPVQSTQSTPVSGQEGESTGASHSEPEENSRAESVNGMTTIQITVGNSTYSAALNDGEASRALIAQMPFTYSMADLNSNEKYSYLSESLPANATRPGQIRAGDIMLYGSDCLVVFYESFSSSYSYTRLGSITDTSGLKSALGSGTVSMTFSVA